MDSNHDIALARQLAAFLGTSSLGDNASLEMARSLVSRYESRAGFESEYILTIAREFCDQYQRRDFWFQLTEGHEQRLLFHDGTPSETIAVVESLVQQHPRGEGFVYGNAHKVGALKTLLNKAWRGKEHITLRHGLAEIATNAGISTIDFSSALETNRPRRRHWIWFCGGLETSNQELVDFFVARLHVGSRHKLILS